MGWEEFATPPEGEAPSGSELWSGGYRPAADRLTSRDLARARYYRTRGWLLCHIGAHYWALLHNPDVGGPRAMYHLCRRCGRERTEYLMSEHHRR